MLFCTAFLTMMIVLVAGQMKKKKYFRKFKTKGIAKDSYTSDEGNKPDESVLMRHIDGHATCEEPNNSADSGAGAGTAIRTVESHFILGAAAAAAGGIGSSVRAVGAGHSSDVVQHPGASSSLATFLQMQPVPSFALPPPSASPPQPKLRWQHWQGVKQESQPQPPLQWQAQAQPQQAQPQPQQLQLRQPRQPRQQPQPAKEPEDSLCLPDGRVVRRNGQYQLWFLELGAKARNSLSRQVGIFGEKRLGLQAKKHRVMLSQRRFRQNEKLKKMKRINANIGSAPAHAAAPAPVAAPPAGKSAWADFCVSGDTIAASSSSGSSPVNGRGSSPISSGGSSVFGSGGSSPTYSTRSDESSKSAIWMPGDSGKGVASSGSEYGAEFNFEHDLDQLFQPLPVAAFPTGIPFVKMTEGIGHHSISASGGIIFDHDVAAFDEIIAASSEAVL